MSAPTADAETADGPTPTKGSFPSDVWINVKRWNRKTIRNPSTPVLELVLGVLALLLFTSVFGEAGALALEENGLGEVEYVTFLLPAVVMQVAMASSISSGTGVVNDLKTGMFDKVVVTPMSWVAVFAGKSASELLRIVFHLLVIVGISIAMGATIDTGVVGVIAIIGVALLFALLYMSLSNILAVTVRDEEALDAAGNILVFPTLFLSSAFLPVSSLPDGIQLFATINPVTYGVDAVRALVVGQDVMTVVEVTRFEGMYNTLVPALAVLLSLNLLFGVTAIVLLSRASSTEAA